MLQHCFYDFCKQTILHGWHYLADLESDTENSDEEAGDEPQLNTIPDIRGTPSPAHRHTFIDRSTNTVNQVFTLRGKFIAIQIGQCDLI